jgi:putative ABC transport system permease protein
VQQIVADVRFAFRTFARRPALLGLVVASLALGIGASSAMFSVVDTVLLRPLPFDHPERLVSVYPTLPELRGHPTLGDLADRGTFSWPEFWDIRDNARSFDAIAAYRSTSRTIMTAGGPPERLQLAEVTPSFFKVLRVNPVLGGVFAEDANGSATNGARAVVLSHRFWQTRLGGRRDVVGSTITLDGDAYTVVGVVPPYTGIGTTLPEAWVPHVRTPRDAEGRGNHSMGGVIGRMREGVTVDQARDEVTRIFRATTPPDHGGMHGGNVFALHGDRTRRVRPALLILLAASGLLLLVACANVAAILLGAGLERMHEIAVRGALGASWRRIIGQMLTESLVLAAIGGVLGVGVAFLAMKGLLLLAPAGVLRIDEAALSGRVLLFAVVIATASGVLFGLLPALTLARQRPATLLQSSRGTVGGLGRGQAVVVIGELALATVLLVGSTLLVRTLWALNSVDPGFKVEELVTVRLAPDIRRFRDLGQDSAQRVVNAYGDRFVAEIASLPGVRGVAVTSNVPLTGDRGNNDVAPEGWTPRGDERLLAERRFVSAGFFGTLGIRMVAGRDFTASDDRDGAPKVMVISEGLARRVWPNEPALGKRISFWGSNVATVVGVAADVRDESLQDITQLAFYVPAKQYGNWGALVVRASPNVDPLSLIQPIRQRVWQVDPTVAIPSVETFGSLVAAEVAEQRYRARLMMVFSALAAIFAGMGVYGVTARSVVRQRRDIGVRLALGAAIGLVASLVVGRSLQGLLYGVRPTDPVTLIVIAALVCGFSVVAALAPGRRATRVSPMEALRSE